MTNRGIDALETVAVLGSGTMGHGIAQVAAQAGYTVRMYDISEESVRAGLDRIERNLGKAISLGKSTVEETAATLANLSTRTDLAAAVRGAGLIIEAVPESMTLKAELLKDLESEASTDAVIATNTSSLSVSDLADTLRRPERFLGLHFFNPVFIMKLVEVVWWSGTKESVLDFGVDFARTLGREPIVVKDSPGFASSRLGVILGLEAMRMVEEGVASAPDIDRAMELGYRHPMGPLKLTDLVGLDVRLGIAEYLHETLGSESFRPPDILREKVARGELGKKSGKGFYEWEDNPR